MKLARAIFSKTLAIAACINLLLISTSYAQRNCDRAKVDRIYDARGFIYWGTYQICDDGIFDRTTGASAPAPGQRLFLVGARAMNRELGSIVRAVPNQSYPVHFAVPDIMDGAVVRWGKDPATTWENVPFILPFVPTQILSIGRDPTEPIYGYTGLVALPGFASSMAPLNSNSVIIAMQGFSFGYSYSLQALLAEFPPDVGYAEILYVQRGETNLQLRRVFVPIFARSRAAANWISLTRAHPIFERDKSANILGWAVLGALIAGIVAFQKSEAGKSYEERRQACLARGLPYATC